MTNAYSIDPLRPKDNGQMTINENRTIIKERGGSGTERSTLIKYQMSRSGLRIKIKNTNQINGKPVTVSLHVGCG